MKAARYYGPGDIRVENIPEPVLKPGQVKLKIAWNGICGSDLHAYLQPSLPYLQGDQPHPVTGESLPITLGHEFSGTIIELAPDVDRSKWKVRANVAVEPFFGCMKTDSCGPCGRGSPTMCPHANFIGIGGWGGGLSEFIAVDTRFVHILPDNIPLDVAACIEPLAVAWYAVKKAGFKPGQSALILGAGPIGMLILKVLRALSDSSTVIISEPAETRRRMAAEHGATLTINPLAPGVLDVVSQIRSLTNGEGVDAVFDAAGVQNAWDTAIAGVRARGTIVIVALWEKDTTVNLNWVLAREVVVTGIAAYDKVHPEVIEALAAGKFPGIEKLITRKIGVEDVVEKGFKALLNEKDIHVKILVHP